MATPRPLILIAVAIVAASAGLLLARSLRPSAPAAPTLTAGTWLEPAKDLPTFELRDTDEKPFGKPQLQGRWSVLFFGFASCPDVCPNTLTVLKHVKQGLGDLPSSRQPRFIFVTVDPQRDTATALRTYVSFFDPAFIGLTGEQTQIDLLTRSLGVPVAVHSLENGAYTFDHSAALFVIDPQARLHALFSAPHDKNRLIQDLRRVLAQNTTAS